MDNPPEIDFGCPPKMRRWLQKFRAWVIAAQPISGLGTDVRQAGKQGRAIDAAIGGGGKKGSSAVVQPFALLDASDEGGHKIRVTTSTLAGAEPDDFNLGDDPPFILDIVGSSGTVYAKIETDSETPYAITSRTIEIAASTPSGDPDAHTFYEQIGSYSLDGDNLSIANNRYGPIGVVPCAREVFFY